MMAMRDAGFNTIRAWLVWGQLEPARHALDLAGQVRLLDLAAKYGLRVGLLFHLHGAPEWAVQEYAHCWYVNQRGVPFEPAARTNTPSGGWPGLCYDHSEVRALEERFISAVVQELAQHPAVAFFEPMNEPHQWVDGPNGGEEYCYCPATRDKFRDWLMQRYPSLQALNTAWGRQHASWEAVRPPTWRFGYTDVVDWRRFTTENVAAEVQWRANVIRRHTSQSIAAHSWGGGSVTCTQLGAMAFDDWRNAQAVDSWGYSAFPSSEDVTAVQSVGLGTDACRGSAQGREFWQSELGTGDLGWGLHRRGRVRSDILAQWTWESIRHGAKGVLYWQYRKEAHGSEIGALGLTGYSGEQTDGLRSAAAIGRVLQQHAGFFLDAKPPAAAVAIVFSPRSYYVNWCDTRDSQLAVDSLAGYYRMFWEANVAVDILHEDFVTAGQLAHYELVVLPFPVALAPRLVSLLKPYVHNGGCLYSDPYLCSWDENLWLSKEVPGQGLAPLFGCREVDMRTRIESVVTRAGRSFSVVGGHFQAELTLGGGQEAARYGAGSRGPAVVRHAAGSGTALYAGVNLGLAYAPGVALGDDVEGSQPTKDAAAARDLFWALVKGPALPKTMYASSSALVGSILQHEDGRTLLIVLNTAEERVVDSLRVPDGGAEGFTRAARLSTEETTPLEDGHLWVDIGPRQTIGYWLVRADSTQSTDE